MDATALEQARMRIEKAEKSLSFLASASNYVDAEEAWIDFLMAASTFYTKLEQGSKSNGKSQAWFGRKKHQRKNDRLMQYLHQARNSAEHGIRKVVQQAGNATGHDGKPLKFGERSLWSIQALDAHNNPTGDVHPAYFYGPTLGFVRVHDLRYGTFCDPPTQHCGNEISLDDNSVHGMGLLALQFLKTVLSEAEALI